MTTSPEKHILNRVKRLHVTKDSNGFWILSLENEDGSLKLLAHRFPDRDVLLHEADLLAATGHLKGAEVVADPPEMAQGLAPAARPTHYVLPQPKRARGS